MLKSERSCLLGDIWQYVDTFLLLSTLGVGCYGHIVVGSQGAAKHATKLRTATQADQ